MRPGHRGQCSGWCMIRKRRYVWTGSGREAVGDLGSGDGAAEPGTADGDQRGPRRSVGRTRFVAVALAGAGAAGEGRRSPVGARRLARPGGRPVGHHRVAGSKRLTLTRLSWRRQSSPKRKKMDFSEHFDEATGMSLTRENFKRGTAAQWVNGVQVVLKRDPSAASGYRARRVGSRHGFALDIRPARPSPAFPVTPAGSVAEGFAFRAWFWVWGCGAGNSRSSPPVVGVTLVGVRGVGEVAFVRCSLQTDAVPGLARGRSRPAPRRLLFVVAPRPRGTARAAVTARAGTRP